MGLIQMAVCLKYQGTCTYIKDFKYFISVVMVSKKNLFSIIRIKRYFCPLFCILYFVHTYSYTLFYNWCYMCIFWLVILTNDVKRNRLKELKYLKTHDTNGTWTWYIKIILRKHKHSFSKKSHLKKLYIITDKSCPKQNSL